MPKEGKQFKGQSRSEQIVQFVNEARWELNSLLAQEEIYWKQMSKQHWLKERDLNTRFFHSYASGRKRKNAVLKLQNDEGVWMDWGDNLEGLMADYFNKLFQSSGCYTEPILRSVS